MIKTNAHASKIHLQFQVKLHSQKNLRKMNYQIKFVVYLKFCSFFFIKLMISNNQYYLCCNFSPPLQSSAAHPSRATSTASGGQLPATQLLAANSAIWGPTSIGTKISLLIRKVIINEANNWEKLLLWVILRTKLK